MLNNLSNINSPYSQSLNKFTGDLLKGLNTHSIYTHNCHMQLVKSLQSNYKMTRDLMGNDLFLVLAQVYVKHNPLSHWDINQFGDDFSHFIAQQVFSLKKNIDWLMISHIADIEGTIVKAYYANGLHSDGRFFKVDKNENVKPNSIDQLKYHHPYISPIDLVNTSQTMYIKRINQQIIISSSLSSF